MQGFTATIIIALFSSLLAVGSRPLAQTAEACGQLAQLLGEIEKEATSITNQLAIIDSKFATWCEFGQRTTIPRFEEYLKRIDANRGNPCFGANEQNIMIALHQHLARVRKDVEEDCKRANSGTSMRAAEDKREKALASSDVRPCIGPIKRVGPRLYHLRLLANCQPIRAAYELGSHHGHFACKTSLLSTASVNVVKSKRAFTPQFLGGCYASASCTDASVRAIYCKN